MIMTIDVRNLDLVKDLLIVVNDEINNNPEKYNELAYNLREVLRKYNIKGDDSIATKN